MSVNRFKKIAALTVMSVVLATTAGAVAQEVDWSSELGSYDGQTLRIIMIQDPWVGAFDVINERFEELTGARVVIDSFGYDETYNKEILAGSSGSSEYDGRAGGRGRRPVRRVRLRRRPHVLHRGRRRHRPVR